MNQPADLSVFQTADGSATLFSPHFDEHYHSVHGAVTESMHVFIRHGLEQKLPAGQPLRILEMGFGTGLNALLTALLCPLPVHYTSLEAYPVPPEMVAQLPYAAQVATSLGVEESQTRAVFEAMHAAAWNVPTVVNGYFILEKRHQTLDTFFSESLAEPTFDLVFYDAFAPSSQPELWTQAVFEQLFARMQPHALLTTYCAKGDVRRAMQAAGLTTERLPGPPHKREMLRASKGE